MQTLSLKITPELHQRLTAHARRRKASQSAIVREALEVYLQRERKNGKGSILDSIRDLIGSAEGPSDLATNKKYMKGYGR